MAGVRASSQTNFMDLDMDILKILPTDEKLNVLLEGMLILNLMQNRLDNIESYVYFNSAAHEVADQRLRVIEYKQIDIEARQREVNLLFSGCTDVVGEDVIQTVKNVLIDNLKLDNSAFQIVKAFRLGRIIRLQSKPQSHQKTQHRQILVTFSDVRQVHLILNNATLLKGTNIGISRDYPKEISDTCTCTRKALWSDFKRLRGVYGAKEVRLTYPAAVIVKVRVHKDLFPDWYTILSQSKTSNVKNRIVETLKEKQEAVKLQLSTPSTQPLIQCPWKTATWGKTVTVVLTEVLNSILQGKITPS